MAISAAQVKELRERTGAGMMECKKALTETEGDMEAAVEHMRKTGLAKADKKADRTAAEGRIAVAYSDDGKAGAIVELNCETDFVARGDQFKEYAQGIAERIVRDRPADVEALKEMAPRTGDAETIRESLKQLIAQLGENMDIRRFELFETSDNGVLNHYLHGERIGVLVELEGGDADLARDIAMHVAASNPACIAEENVPQELIEKEKAVFQAQAEESGKPQDIIEKMITGRINKFLKEVTLLGQPFVKDPDQSVAQLLEDKGAKTVRFVRLEVGEGIEKEEANFAEEVMAQVQGS
ncbi:MAG: translation elongation factor Ts [Pseudomonadota bacterium]